MTVLHQLSHRHNSSIRTPRLSILLLIDCRRQNHMCIYTQLQSGGGEITGVGKQNLSFFYHAGSMILE